MYLPGPDVIGLRNRCNGGPEAVTSEIQRIGIRDATPLALDLGGGVICRNWRGETTQQSLWLHPEGVIVESIAVLLSAFASCIAALAG
jgi:hypothetical protein